jgi:P27 family predicted phage terminase small subunit
MGHRPLPTALKRLRGNPGKRKLSAGEPQPQLCEPEMPTWIPELAKEAWRTLVPKLMRLGLLSEIDHAALTAVCVAFARWREAEAEITRLGQVISQPVLNKKGELVGYRTKANPAVAIANEANRIMRSYLVEFGATPASLGKVGRVEAPKEADPLELYLLKKQNAAKVVQ